MGTRTAAAEIVAIQSRLATETMPVRDRRFLLTRQAEIWERDFPEMSFERIVERAELVAA